MSNRFEESDYRMSNLMQGLKSRNISVASVARYYPQYTPVRQRKTLGMSGFDRAYRSRNLTKSLENLNALGFDDYQAIELLSDLSGGVR